MIPAARCREIAFRLIALGCVATAVYHVVGIFAPDLLEPSPPWRHALFVGVNGGLALGCLRRPRFFVYLVALLSAQQVVSHGARAIEIWSAERRVDWSSIAVLVGIPALLVLLILDARERVAAPPPSAPPPDRKEPPSSI